VDGGQRRVDGVAEHYVIEANDGHLRWDTDAVRMQCSYRPDCRKVVRGNYCSRARCSEQGTHRRIAASDPVVSIAYEFRIVGETNRQESLPKGFEPKLRREQSLHTADESNPAMSKFSEMKDRLSVSSFEVDCDISCAFFYVTAIHRNDRDLVKEQGLDGPGVKLRSHKYDAIHTTRQHTMNRVNEVRFA